MSVSEVFYPSGDAKTFAKFSKLPAEIRVRIWRFASFHRRNIPVEIKRLPHLKGSLVGKYYHIFRFRSDIPTPTLFSVCREARWEAKKHFKRILGAKHILPYFSMTVLPRFYTNHVCDTILPVGRYTVHNQDKLLDGMRRSHLRHIALDESQLAEKPFLVRAWTDVITTPPTSLQSLKLCVGPDPGTPYSTGSRGSFGETCLPDWDSLTLRQQCSLCAAISKFTLHVTSLRKSIPHQLAIDDLATSLGRPRSLMFFHAIGMIRSHAFAFADELKNWIPPRLELMVNNIPARVRELFKSNRKVPYQCRDKLCRVCRGAGGFMI